MSQDTAIIVSEGALLDLRRQLISQLKTIEDILDLPSGKRALVTRAERRANSEKTAAKHAE